mmetsp:Transcript_17263/g.42843  ORF Transcript_17263/g.42843 Transcript_17263/m.42843 type:complete len:180 (+) Transcript_17263:321-860(+)
MAEVFDAIDAWEESMPWSEYRTEVLLFSEETTRDETKVVAHIILRGIKPHQPRWYKAANRMPQAWRVTKKDPTYKNATDPNDEIAIKYYTPVERFLAWMDRAEAYILMKRAPRLFDHISEHLHRIKMRLDQNPDNPDSVLFANLFYRWPSGGARHGLWRDARENRWIRDETKSVGTASA